jgi:hypothetical protein
MEQALYRQFPSPVDLNVGKYTILFNLWYFYFTILFYYGKTKNPSNVSNIKPGVL